MRIEPACALLALTVACGGTPADDLEHTSAAAVAPRSQAPARLDAKLAALVERIGTSPESARQRLREPIATVLRDRAAAQVELIGSTQAQQSALLERLERIVADGTLSLEDMLVTFIFTILDELERDVREQLEALRRSHHRPAQPEPELERAPGTAPAPVTMEEMQALSRRRRVMFQSISGTIDALRRTTDDVLRSLGR